MGVRADAESLRRIPIFSSCETVPLQVLAFAAEREKFAPGKTVIAEGGSARSAYFILEGTALVSRAKQTVGMAEPGTLLGETAMLGSHRYMVTAVAETQLVVARIDSALFQRVATEYPEFGDAVLQALSDRLALSMREFEEVRVKLTRARNLSGL
jgi:CRP-like cAMP-binding protein